MNENAAVQAVYDTLNDNKTTLVDSLTQNGAEKELSWLSDTLTAVPDAYYAVGVHCINAEEYSHPDAINANLASPYITTYQMMIRVADAAFLDNADELFGSTAYANFRAFCGRIVKLFRRDQVWFPSASADPRFRILSDSRTPRRVRVENDLPTPIQDTIAMLSASILFTLTGCDD